MTKRTVEATLRDELAGAEREVAAEARERDKLKQRMELARVALVDAGTKVSEAEERVIRARNALAALTGKSLDELLEETKARQETTGTHDPADFATGGPVEGPVDAVVGESGPEVVSPKRGKAK